MKHFIVAALAMLPLAAYADENVSKCDVHGFANDPDPEGTNIRSGPSASAPVIGHLPPRHYEKQADVTISPEFEIIGSKDGWLQIANATDGHVGEDNTFTFKGPGWISGALVGFTIGSTQLRSAPSLDAPKTVSLMNGSFGPDSYDVKRVYACKDRFVDISVQLSSNMKKSAPVMRGWAATVCSNRLTTCDGGE
jgi:hypothetical protein